MRSPSRRPSSANRIRSVFGRRVRTLRDARDWTQAVLAERTGLDVSYISQIERGLRDPSLTSLHAIAKGFGLGLGELFDEQSEATQPHALTLQRIATEIDAMPESALPVIVDLVALARRLTAGK